MKARILLFVTLGVGGLAASGWTYMMTAYPRVHPAIDVRIERTPERLTRGKYLANNVAGCVDCHSQRDFSRFSGPVVAGTEGAGGMRFDVNVGMPGAIYPPNITPAGLASWSDGEILRALTEGVSRDGRPLFPMMPYEKFAQMSQEDLYSIVAFIRTLPAVQNIVPAPQIDFPVNLIMRTLPKKAELQSVSPSRNETVAYGEYLTRSADCMSCHTVMDHGKPVSGMEFAGGYLFKLPTGVVIRSANITPDMKTGIGGWTREAFIERFKKAQAGPVKASEFNTVMPWVALSGMSEADLGAIYDYLRTLKPVEHQVERFSSNQSKGE